MKSVEKAENLKPEGNRTEVGAESWPITSARWQLPTSMQLKNAVKAAMERLWDGR